MNRREDLNRLYELLNQLRNRVGGYRYLKDCDWRTGWPKRGVYFFFEHGEEREDGHGLRVVRIGTHAVSDGSRATLWERLSQHKGHIRGEHPGGGNHRGSIFRLHVGAALLNSCSYPAEIRRSWGKDNSGGRIIRHAEYPLEKDVSEYIRNMPFLWVEVSDPAGLDSDRKVIEAGAVALLSNLGKAPIDPPSPKWLGRYADRGSVRDSGLWNVNHVNGQYKPAFLDRLQQHVLSASSRK